MSLTRAVVVPCFNEAQRLDGQRLLSLVDARTSLVLVDDGSTDNTRALLHELARSDPTHVHVVALNANVGKAEAVRQGLLRALHDDVDVVAYLDADLATPPREMQRVLAVLDDEPEVQVAFGARVALLGRHIERRAGRHYAGRVFATVASLALQLPVYDTQCGAKALRATDALRAALAQPFLSSWIFDVELFGRLLRGTSSTSPVPASAFVEVPLHEWRDVGGSKLTVSAMARAGADLVRVTRELRRRR